MLLQERERFRKAIGFSSNWCLKHSGSFYYLYRLIFTWESRETQPGGRQRHWFLKSVLDASVSNFTKHQMWLTNNPRPSYTIPHSGMALQILAWIMSFGHLQLKKKYKVIIHFTVRSARIMPWPQPDWVTFGRGSSDRVWLNTFGVTWGPGPPSEVNPGLDWISLFNERHECQGKSSL